MVGIRLAVSPCCRPSSSDQRLIRLELGVAQPFRPANLWSFDGEGDLLGCPMILLRLFDAEEGCFQIVVVCEVGNTALESSSASLDHTDRISYFEK